MVGYLKDAIENAQDIVNDNNIRKKGILLNEKTGLWDQFLMAKCQIFKRVGY